MEDNQTDKPLPPLRLRSHHPDSEKEITLRIPVINGGMGVGVTGPALASAITNEGGGGVLTGVVLGYPFQKILGKLTDKKPFEANRLALEEWITTTKTKCDGGFVGVNIMVALNDFKDMAHVSAKSGVDLIIAGAGLPMALPEIVNKFPDTMIAPIISSVKAARVMVKKWMAKGRAPDAIIYESIHHSGGHQGGSIDDILTGMHQPRDVVSETRKMLDDQGLEDVPVIAAGGIWDKNDILEALSWGAQGVQMASRFLLTVEAGLEFGGIKLFKKLFMENDIPTILERSPAGLPSRAVETPFSKRFAAIDNEIIKEPHECPSVCLASCDKQKSIYCILDHLTEALKDNLEKGLFFAGSNVGKKGISKKILPVKELMDLLAHGEPAGIRAAAGAHVA
ncbi:MAG: nitronate monooxygenase [Nitrospinota bacterium]|nr:nitronate monooxygenase [Nitrospinota bacterium]MDH5679284.1 nitronate monooxygenase [Nitrospinota bacterium]MDH5757024.1 nitronate monooxygenase [Nitrospinota bacterium]